MGILVRAALVLAVSLVLTTGCEDKTTSPPPPGPPLWEIKPDSMNLGILILDYLTFEFEGGRVDHYAPCDTCDRDSLPFEQIYNPPLDFGDITFRYTETSDTLLFATTVWAGSGRIVYPDQFIDPKKFEYLPEEPKPPTGFEYFMNMGRTDPFSRADSAWHKVSSLDIVADFAESPYRVGIYRHGAASGDADPTINSWVIFLYRCQYHPK